MHDCKGRHLLAKWLKENSVTFAEFARGISVSEPTVHDWLKGVKRPKDARRCAIAIFTHGVVAEVSWQTADEATAVANVRPFEPTTAAEG